MPPMLTAAFDRSKRIVSGFTVAQRTIAIIGVALLAMGVFALGAWLTRPQMSPLFTGLSAADASAVVEQLKSSGVDYDLADGGATILVPDADVYSQRLAAASAGLPGDTGEGYALLDEMGVTASEFQQSVTYKRAIEGELASTIGAMDGISAASVQLAVPEESVFVSEKQNPTASVFVRTQGGSTLGDDQVAAIVHLTSAAVAGMRPEDVAVTDQNGTVLSAVGTGPVGGAPKQASEYEAKVAASVSRMLETIVGPGMATVTVAADVANSTAERLEETYTAPDGDLIPTEKTKSETYTGSGGGGAGVLGPDNIAVPNGAEGDGSYELEETTRSNAVNKATEKTITPAGSVTRQTISVALDSTYVTGITAAQVEDLVATAAGINPERGDTVTVEFVQFSQSAAASAEAALTAAEAEQAGKLQQELLRSAIIGGAILLVAIVLGIIVAVRRRRRQRTEDRKEMGRLEAIYGITESEEAKLRALRSLADPIALPATTPLSDRPTAVLDIVEEPEVDQVLVERRRREIDQFAAADPEAAAVALANLMDEATA